METKNEIWKDVRGYEGLYEVSDQGRVRSCSDGMIKYQGTNPDGYKTVSLRKDGVSVTAQVHRLVAFAFVDGYRPGLVVNHINEQKGDNCACNLEWCSRAFNAVYNDANRKGRDKAVTRSVLSEKHKNIGRRFREMRKGAGLKLSETAQLAGISEGYLIRIESGTTTFSFDVLENLANVFGYTFELTPNK